MKIDVAIPNTKFDFLTYNSYEELKIGDLVLVPLRDKLKYGIVIKTNSQREVAGIKNIKKVVERNIIHLNSLRLYKWLADYYLSTLGDVLKLAFPAKILKKYESSGRPEEYLIQVREPILTYSQSSAVEKILFALKKKTFKTFLLYGITGSGKTEVYLRCMAEVIKGGGRGLVLVPEISMTPLLLNRFRERFGYEVVTIHSALTEKERGRIWYGIKNGEFKIAIGPRSAIFLPIPDLRLIIVDEEHDHSYKEHEHTLKYNARDVAVMRGKIENAVVVLGSATPQIESYHNAGIGKYELITLKERIYDRPLPKIEIIDLRKEKNFITAKLAAEIEKTLANKEQVILFLNRRGFAPKLICPSCGYLATCPYCKLPLVYHKSASTQELAVLSCHICNYKLKTFSICPECGRATLLYRGAGTQRIEEMVYKIIKHLKLNIEHTEPSVLRLDRDSAKKKGEAEKILKTFEEDKPRILLGTQLVTKGFDFPLVTLVGIVNADISLHLPDFRSGERTFQILTQVAGRSGRGERPGKVLIQTFHPEQYSILFSQLQNYPKFYTQEIKFRKELNFPPFSRLILLRFSGNDENVVWNEAKRIFEIICKIKGVISYGPNRSFYYKIRKNYRVYILIKTGLNFPHSRLKFLKHIKIKGVRFEVDVDPLEIF